MNLNQFLNYLNLSCQKIRSLQLLFLELHEIKGNGTLDLVKNIHNTTKCFKFLRMLG